MNLIKLHVYSAAKPAGYPYPAPHSLTGMKFGTPPCASMPNYLLIGKVAPVGEAKKVAAKFTG